MACTSAKVVVNKPDYILPERPEVIQEEVPVDYYEAAGMIVVLIQHIIAWEEWAEAVKNIIEE